MPNYFIFSSQKLIDVANGAPVFTTTGPTSGASVITITTAGSGYGTSAATYKGESEALNALIGTGGAGFTLVQVTGWGSSKEWVLYR